MGQQNFAFTIDGQPVCISTEQLEHFSKPGPRYTSYPTVPEWDDQFGPNQFARAIAGRNANPMSLYVHLPFCQSLCLYCGCNVIISKDHGVAAPYLQRVKQELDQLARQLGTSAVLEQMHWGGGTPTYITVREIEELFGHIASRFTISETAEIGIEIEPRTTTAEQLHVLRQLGFNRISMGAQDFDPRVQQAIRRIQPYEQTRDVFNQCRTLGFESINMDLIYGLPHQTAGSFAETARQAIELSPDRIALFSYAHVPWLKKQQRSFERHLPPLAEKFAIFTAAAEAFSEAGYRFIGLDHFVHPTDELSRALDERTLHRNFQGYTTKAGCDLFGVGLTSISALDGVYAQNQRDLADYYEAIDAERLPTMRGIELGADDRIRRHVINQLMCHGEADIKAVERLYAVNFGTYFAAELEHLAALQADGLVIATPVRIQLTGLGRIFARNVAAVFDAYMRRANTAPERRYSRTL